MKASVFGTVSFQKRIYFSMLILAHLVRLLSVRKRSTWRYSRVFFSFNLLILKQAISHGSLEPIVFCLPSFGYFDGIIQPFHFMISNKLQVTHSLHYLILVFLIWMGHDCSKYPFPFSRRRWRIKRRRGKEESILGRAALKCLADKGQSSRPILWIL